MEIKRFDIYILNLPNDNVVHSQSGERPYLVIQNDTGNKYSPNCLVLPMTSQIKRLEQPTHVLVTTQDAPGLSCDSMVLAENIRMIDKSLLRPERRKGRIQNKKTQHQVGAAYIANFTGKADLVPELIN